MCFGKIKKLSLWCFPLINWGNWSSGRFIYKGRLVGSLAVKMGKRGKKKTAGDLVVFNDDQHEDCEGAVRQYKPLPGRVEKGELDLSDFLAIFSDNRYSNSNSFL